jgi:hypothetical protein
MVVDVPYGSLSNYVCEDKAKRCDLGKSPGRPYLIVDRDQDFIRNILAHQDRANEGSNMQDAIDIVQELAPNISHDQAQFHLSRTLLKGDTSVVKSRAVVAQQTMTKRSNITVKQQYRWHMTYENSLTEL